MKPHGSVVALLACTWLACSEPGPVELVQAEAALLAGDHEQALARYERALARLDPREPGYVAARLGAIEAEIPIDAKRAKDGFLQLAREHPVAIDARRYAYVAARLAAAEAWEPALELFDAALERFGQDEPMLSTWHEWFKRMSREQHLLSVCYL